MDIVLVCSSVAVINTMTESGLEKTRRASSDRAVSPPVIPAGTGAQTMRLTAHVLALSRVQLPLIYSSGPCA